MTTSKSVSCFVGTSVEAMKGRSEQDAKQQAGGMMFSRGWLSDPSNKESLYQRYFATQIVQYQTVLYEVVLPQYVQESTYR